MPSITFAELAVYYLIAINFAAFAAFGIDKSQAENGGRRISEASLIGLASMGGILGALAGRSLFRHKTRKHGFTALMMSGAVVNALLAVAGYFAFVHLIGPELRRAHAMMDPAERARAEAVMATVHYAGCNEVRAAGKAPLYYGEPGYAEYMDGDGDGVACENF